MTLEEFKQLSEEAQQVYLGKGFKFDRIRRVTGYLNPDVRQWNDGKQAELRLRKAHSLDY